MSVISERELHELRQRVDAGALDYLSVETQRSIALRSSRISRSTLQGKCGTFMTTPRFYAHSPVEEINVAIDSYPKRVLVAGTIEAAPYNRESLAEIYAPRVRQLLDLQSEGFTHARWGFDPETRQNRWFGASF